MAPAPDGASQWGWLAGWLLGTGKVAFFVMSLAAGAHLARLARASREMILPGIVSAIIWVGGLGILLFGVGEWLGEGAAAHGALVVGDLSMRVAFAGLYVFVWKVFRPGSLPALVAAAAGIASLVASAVLEGASQALPHYDRTLLSYRVTQAVFAAPCAWSTLETLLYHRKLKRQIAVGLAEPGGEGRLLFWAGAMGAFVGVNLSAIAGSYAAGAGAPEWVAAAAAGRGLLMWAIAGLLWVGFYGRRAGAAAGDAGAAPA